ncbi:MAG: MFS transporter [Anaerolineae bacterium]
MTTIANHSLFRTLRELKGNPRITVLTELMFGIPFNLFSPFLSVYMLALGVTDQGIGTIASLGLAFQILGALLSGAIVDKYGRRLTLFIADLVAWSVPCLIWAAAQNMRYFLAAAMLNGLFRISHTAWTCLMVEDAEERHLVHIWTWVTIFGICASFFTPLGGWLVGRLGLVPAMRGLLIFGCVMLTAKALVLYLFSHETVRGKQRIEETRHSSLFSLLGEYSGVFKQILHSRPILAALALMIIANIFATVNGSFWGVLFTTKLGFAESQISIYAMLRSIIIALCFFLIGPRLTTMRHFRLPLWIGYASFFVGQALLVFMPPRMVPLLVISVALEGVGAALINPMLESLLAVAMESHERARISAIVYVILIAFTSPFGWIAGQLSAIDRALPFAMNMGLFVIGAGLVWLIGRRQSFASLQKE